MVGIWQCSVRTVGRQKVFSSIVKWLYGGSYADGKSKLVLPRFVSCTSSRIKWTKKVNESPSPQTVQLSSVGTVCKHYSMLQKKKSRLTSSFRWFNSTCNLKQLNLAYWKQQGTLNMKCFLIPCEIVTCSLSCFPFVRPFRSLWQGLSSACQDGAFPWQWWPVLWCWVVSCWCLVWPISVATGRYSKLSSSAPSCWCSPTSGKENATAAGPTLILIFCSVKGPFQFLFCMWLLSCTICNLFSTYLIPSNR